MRVFAPCVSILMAVSMSARADFEATPFFGYRVGGSLDEVEGAGDFEIDEDSSFGLVFNYDQTVNTQWELYLGRQETSLQAAEPFAGTSRFDLDVDYYHLGGIYAFDRGELRPYIVATLGATRLSPRPAGLDDELRFSMSLGMGVRYLPSDQFGIRTELRGFGTLFDDDTELFCGSLGGEGLCAVTLRSSLLTQVELWTGVIFRF